jgi:WD40 repeat protein
MDSTNNTTTRGDDDTVVVEHTNSVDNNNDYSQEAEIKSEPPVLVVESEDEHGNPVVDTNSPTIPDTTSSTETITAATESLALLWEDPLSLLDRLERQQQQHLQGNQHLVTPPPVSCNEKEDDDPYLPHSITSTSATTDDTLLGDFDNRPFSPVPLVEGHNDTLFLEHPEPLHVLLEHHSNNDDGDNNNDAQDYSYNNFDYFDNSNQFDPLDLADLLHDLTLQGSESPRNDSTLYTSHTKYIDATEPLPSLYTFDDNDPLTCLPELAVDPEALLEIEPWTDGDWDQVFQDEHDDNTFHSPILDIEQHLLSTSYSHLDSSDDQALEVLLQLEQLRLDSDPSHSFHFNQDDNNQYNNGSSTDDSTFTPLHHRETLPLHPPVINDSIVSEEQTPNFAASYESTLVPADVDDDKPWPDPDGDNDNDDNHWTDAVWSDLYCRPCYSDSPHPLWHPDWAPFDTTPADLEDALDELDRWNESSSSSSSVVVDQLPSTMEHPTGTSVLSPQSTESSSSTSSSEYEESSTPVSPRAQQWIDAAATTPKIEQVCWGHKERILGVSFSDCGQFLATASQDSTVQIWNVATHTRLSILKDHDAQFECLRVAWAPSSWNMPTPLDVTAPPTTQDSYVLATAGADGRVHVYSCGNPLDDAWVLQTTLDHATLNHCIQRRRLAAAAETKSTSGNDNKKGSDTTTTETALGDSPIEGSTNSDNSNKNKEEDSGAKVIVDDDDRPQIYAVQFIDDWSALPTSPDSSEDRNRFLVTSSDDHVHVWEREYTHKRCKHDASPTDPAKDSSAASRSCPWQFREVFSWRFGQSHEYGYGVQVTQVTSSSILSPVSGSLEEESGETTHHDPGCTGNPTDPRSHFGGERNPEGIVYVFDACYCSKNQLLGVALSDGTVRLVHGRGVCVGLWSLPHVDAHLTAVRWSPAGDALVTSVATGHVIVWNWTTRVDGSLQPHCRAIYSGGHILGRPLFGALFMGADVVLSWGVDGRVCVWDGVAREEVTEPWTLLLDKPDYPVYAVDVHPGKGLVAVGGGASGEVSFVGTPVYLYQLPIRVDASSLSATKPTSDALPSEIVADASNRTE